MKRLGVLFLLFASTASIASEREIRSQCSDGSLVDMLACLVDGAKASASNLDVQERLLAEAIEQWDESPELRVKAQEARRLAHQSFVIYRKAQCDFSMRMGGGAVGSALEMRRLACVIELNTHYAEMLAEKADGLPKA